MPALPLQETPPSLRSGGVTEGAGGSPLAAIVRESRLLGELTRTYGWSTEDQSAFVQGIVAPLQGAPEWRLQKILDIDRQYGLGIKAGGGARVLDAGSGAGSVTIAARRKGLDMTGVELDAGSLELARGLAAASGPSAALLPDMFIRANLSQLPFRAESFSMITCHQVLEHTDAPQVVLQEMRRCLVPGGLLWLDAPDYRFCYEPHYRIPWLPYMSEADARHWLNAFERPLGGLGTFAYTCLPQCVQMLELLNMEIRQATTTTPVAQIDEQLRSVTGHPRLDHPPQTAEEIRALAERVRRSGFCPPPTSLLILARRK